jgi:hypothetical protein
MSRRRKKGSINMVTGLGQVWVYYHSIKQENGESRYLEGELITLILDKFRYIKVTQLGLEVWLKW